MSKRKLLIHEVFNRIRKSSEKNTKGGLASDLANYLEEKLSFIISKRTLVRYYEAYIEGDEEIDIELYILNRLSQYLGFNDYEHFSTTIEKKGEDASKTTVKIDVDDNEVSSASGTPNVTVNITNTNSNNNQQHFKVPEFIKQNGLGILEMTFVILLVTGGVVFPHTKEPSQNSTNHSILSLWGKLDDDKKYMYWDGERYIATDSSYIGPEFEVIAMDKKLFQDQRRITRKDTMTLENSLGRTWYSKYYGDVEFFTADGIDPDNKRELRKSTELIIGKYAGKNADTIQAQ